MLVTVEFGRDSGANLMLWTFHIMLLTATILQSITVSATNALMTQCPNRVGKNHKENLVQASQELPYAI